MVPGRLLRCFTVLHCRPEYTPCGCLIHGHCFDEGMDDVLKQGAGRNDKYIYVMQLDLETVQGMLRYRTRMGTLLGNGLFI